MQFKTRLCPLFVLVGLLATSLATAEISITAEDDRKAEQKVSELTWADKNDLELKVQIVEGLGQRHYGRSLRHDLSDLALLQRIADDKLIKQRDVEKLQALGAVLGDSLKRELGLEWKVYADAKGRSRALCVPETEYCLFPLTMLSRRLEVGLPVNVRAVYNDAVEDIEPYLADNNAYDGTKPDPRDKPSWIDDRKTRPPVRIRVQ